MTLRRPSRYALVVGAVCVVVLFFHAFPPGSASNPTTSASPTPIVFKPASFDWSTITEFHPIEDPPTPLPTNGKHLPSIQNEFSPFYENDARTESRRTAVKSAFLRSWNSYKKHAWLSDELAPVSGKGKNTFGGWAATLVDSLDTLWIMDLQDEFREAATAAVAIDWNNTTETGVNLFETTIRHLGGLLSAYDLSGERALLDKAKELGEMLYLAFDTPNRMPGFWFNFENVKAGSQVAGSHDPSAAPSSLSMEFTRLAQLTGEDKYYDAIDRVRAFLRDTQEDSVMPGMWPTMIDFQNKSVREDNVFSVGALADSLYEYLLKTFILLGGADQSWRAMYERSMEEVTRHLLFRPMLPEKDDILFAGTTFVHGEDTFDLVPESQHLSCFLGGLFALGGRVLSNEKDVEKGNRLARGCAWAYEAFPTGVMPEIFTLIKCPNQRLTACPWNETLWEEERTEDLSLTKGVKDARDPRYLLRPEAIESLFILYRVTGDKDLQDIAWTMFEHVMKATTTKLANSAIKDVNVEGVTTKEDSMESFWLSETLKYYYLIFSLPHVISLDEYVFNTEAHPFRRQYQ